MAESKIETRQRFTFLDIFRIFGGLLIFSSVLSYWFTGTASWNLLEGKYTNVDFYKFELSRLVFPSHYGTMSLKQLSLYNGTDSSLPIYISVNGTIFDVTKSKHIYGPGGRYHIFAGHDYSRLFVNGCFKRRDQWTFDLRGLDRQAVQLTLGKWSRYFTRHPEYWRVGSVDFPSLKEIEPPKICDDGLVYPGF